MEGFITYTVPSQSQPGIYYDVDLDPDTLEGHCPCRWGQSPKSTELHPCFHVEAAQVLELAAEIGVKGADFVDRAQRGDFRQQVTIFTASVEILARRGAIRKAARCAEILSKYLTAISIQGAAAAVPPVVQQSTVEALVASTAPAPAEVAA